MFYRSGNGSISIVYLSAVFSLAHLHKHVRKAISGKSRGVRVVLFQLVFTFVFSLYAYYFLQRFQSVVPCILLHCYCNIIGPPVVRKSTQPLTQNNSWSAIQCAWACSCCSPPCLCETIRY